jgi:O-antigen biosynthesis protein
MDLSIIIVNYNVKYFLEQALFSVFKAGLDLSYEVIVVDNDSADDSVQMVREKYPEVHLIENKHNPGFSIANNQGLAIARGRYILFLNPDTIVSEDTFRVCVDFMDTHPEAGAIGVKMVDGGGNYLPESKRGLPTPATAFFKAIGLHRLFPGSKVFNRYYLGHLSDDEINEIEVLCGAFMFVRKDVLDRTGGFDEQFFMYGEDIDLSYRIIKEGFKIYFLPTTSIIHFKGESTRKASFKYIRHFYEAMLIFADKHFKNGYPWILRVFLGMGVFLRAGLTLFKNAINNFIWPFTDLLIIVFCFVAVKQLWSVGYHGDPDYYSGVFERVNLPVFLVVWMLTFFLSGVYDKVYSLGRLVKSIILGLLVNGLIYGMLDASNRPSRPILIFGFFAILLALPLARLIVYRLRHRKWLIGGNRINKVAIVAGVEEYLRLKEIIKSSGQGVKISGRIQPLNFVGIKSEEDIGDSRDLEDIIRLHNLDEIVLSSSDMGPTDIMKWLSKFGQDVKFKIASPNSDAIIGSQSKNSIGEFYTHSIDYNIATPEYRRLKRIVDFVSGLTLLILIPLIIWFYKNKSALLMNCLATISGRMTMVGYGNSEAQRLLPNIKSSVLNRLISEDPDVQLNQDIRYARYYSPMLDLDWIMRNLAKLDSK